MNLPQNKNKNKKGFTLIELLVVIAIIGMITAIIFTYLDAARKKGRDAQRIANIKQLQESIEVYFSQCNTYPTSLAALNLDCSGNASSNKILASIPNDPLGTQYSYAFAINPTFQYHVCASLELGNTNGIGKSGHAPIVGVVDNCDGTNGNTYDRYGP